MISQVIPFEKLNNTRDLGGMPGADGRRIKKGKLIRSGHLYFASPRDIECLSGKIGLIVDFRNKQEAAEKELSETNAAADVDKLITALGDVTLDSKSAVEAARKAYEALLPDAKNKVTKLSDLNAAELLIQKLEAEKAAAENALAEQTEEEAAPAEVGTEVVSAESEDSATYVVISSDVENPTVEYEGAEDASDNKTIVIPDTVIAADGVAYEVTRIADNALKNNKKVTTVTIGENITEIGSNAFQNCTGLKKVVVKSNKIEKIDNGAFSGDKALTTVDLSKCEVKSIGKNAFSGCKKLKNIKVNGNKITKVGKGAFKNVKKNAKITIYAKNKKTYNKMVTLIKKSGAKKVKYAFKKKK